MPKPAMEQKQRQGLSHRASSRLRLAVLLFATALTVGILQVAESARSIQSAENRVKGDEGIFLGKSLESVVSGVAVDGNVVVTQASCGYLQFADSWAAHLEAIGTTNYVFIAEDDSSAVYLESRFPGHVAPVFLIIKDSSLPGSIEMLDWEAKDFKKLNCMRPTYLLAFTGLGYNALWLDLDISLLHWARPSR